MRYHRPRTIADALDALMAEPRTSRVLAGGTDLLVALRHRTVEPSLLVDIKDVEDLRPSIEVADDAVTFGPTATMSEVASHPGVRARFPGLVEAAVLVGSIAIRNRATLVANCANGSPAADTAPALLALDATATIASTDGERTVALRDFFISPRVTLCAPGEIITSLRVPSPSAGSSSAYQRMTRRRGVDLATVGLAVAVDGEGRLQVGMGAVGPTPLLGRADGPVDPAVDDLGPVIEVLLESATPIGDVRAGRDYRAAMLRVLARRTLLRAAARRDLTSDELDRDLPHEVSAPCPRPAHAVDVPRTANDRSQS